MPRPQPSILRALGKVSIAPIANERKRQRWYDQHAMQNMAQQVQVPIQGRTLVSGPVHISDHRVPFPYPFVDGSARMDSNLDNPHFSHSVEWVVADWPLFGLACVTGWEHTPEGWTTAARCRFSVWSPDGVIADFIGIFHCTFTGFAAPVDDEFGVTDAG